MRRYTAGRRGDPTCPASPPPLPTSLSPRVSPPPSHAYIPILPPSNRPPQTPAPARSHPNLPSSRSWTPNISALLERGYRCCGQNGSILEATARARWFKYHLKQLFLKVKHWCNLPPASRGSLKIGIRCRGGRHHSVALLLLFGACCRHFDHTIFVYAAQCESCQCPSQGCKSVRDRAMWQTWKQQAQGAKTEAIQVWDGFRKGW